MSRKHGFKLSVACLEDAVGIVAGRCVLVAFQLELLHCRKAGESEDSMLCLLCDRPHIHLHDL